MKVNIKNFNCIKNIDIEFPESSIVVITGDSNNGKSSIFKAIRTFALNSPGNHYIRQGQTTCDIQVESKGHVVKRHRTAQSASYEVDGNLVQKLGFNTIDSPIKLDTSSDHLNFWDQMTPPFLLGRTPTEVYKYLVQSRYVSSLAYATDQAQDDIKAIKNQILTDTAQIDLIEQQISDIKLEKYDSIIKSKESADRLKVLSDTFDKLSLLVANLPELPERPIKPNIDITRLDSTLQSITTIMSKVNQLESYINVLPPRSVTYLTDKYNKIEEIINSYMYVTDNAVKYEKANTDLTSIQDKLDGIQEDIMVTSRRTRTSSLRIRNMSIMWTDNQS